MRQSEVQRVKNQDVGTGLKTARKKLFAAIEAKDKKGCAKLYSEYCSALDKAAKKGVIKKNTAVRRKGRAANQIRGLK